LVKILTFRERTLWNSKKRAIFAARLKKNLIERNKKHYDMTKADIVTEISNKTGIDRNDVLAIVEGFMGTVKNAMENGENVYLRGFGSFIVKKRAEKLGRNILAKTSVVIPAHYIPAFKPAKEFMDDVKAKVKVDQQANA
jgi:DNA-binding protein HU-beta